MYLLAAPASDLTRGRSLTDARSLGVTLLGILLVILLGGSGLCVVFLAGVRLGGTGVLLAAVLRRVFHRSFGGNIGGGRLVILLVGTFVVFLITSVLPASLSSFLSMSTLLESFLSVFCLAVGLVAGRLLVGLHLSRSRLFDRLLVGFLRAAAHQTSETHHSHKEQGSSTLHFLFQFVVVHSDRILSMMGFQMPPI